MMTTRCISLILMHSLWPAAQFQLYGYGALRHGHAGSERRDSGEPGCIGGRRSSKLLKRRDEIVAGSDAAHVERSVGLGRHHASETHRLNISRNQYYRG